jgi:hypothetical protein
LNIKASQQLLKYETSRNPYYLGITFQWGPFTVSSTVC